MYDLGAHFKITDKCFLCGEEAELDFNCAYGGHIWRAPVCMLCMASYEDDLHVLLALIIKANEMHEAGLDAETTKESTHDSPSPIVG